MTTARPFKSTLFHRDVYAVYILGNDSARLYVRIDGGRTLDRAAAKLHSMTGACKAIRELKKTTKNSCYAEKVKG